LFVSVRLCFSVTVCVSYPVSLNIDLRLYNGLGLRFLRTVSSAAASLPLRTVSLAVAFVKTKTI